MDDSISAKYEEQLEDFQLTLMGSDLVVAKKEGQVLAKVPLTEFKSEFEKRENKSWDEIDLDSILENYRGEIIVEASFNIQLGSPYSYGDDIDGNRGVQRRDLEDISADDLDITKLEFRIIDEDGEALGGDDFFVEIDETDAVAEYISQEVNKDLSSYA